ncbi:MAG: NAD+ synthase [Candidatus Margulisiibacteriota bacterium]
MKIALAQINPTVGDLSGNVRKIVDFISRAKKENAELVVFPEMATTGYPPEDLLLKPQFVSDNLASLREIIKASKKIATYIGFVDRKGRDLFNAGAFVIDGKLKETYHKINLPNYAVFDEKRYFKEGKKISVVNYKGMKIGLGICEDIWVEKGPYQKEAQRGAKLILNINASPYHVGKVREREKILKLRAKMTKSYVVYVNLVGGQDELVFDGGSMVVNPAGRIIAACEQYREKLAVFDLEKGGEIVPWLDELTEIYEALLLGVADYVNKNGFGEVVVGLSGGIDSALTLTIAVDALGSNRVHALFMPSPYTSEQSYRNAEEVAKNLRVDFKVLPISEVFSSYLKVLAPYFEKQPVNIAEENVQARIRGNYLMAFSNKFGWLVLTTGNKSETSTGYCTLYGDMAGGFNVLKDIPKTLVYRLVNWRNKKGQVIPESVIKRAPTAELKPNQTDQDTLPPYEILDPIMRAYVEQNKSLKQIVNLGFDEATVKKVVSMIDRSEYKRRQAPPGPRITSRAFGKDWRLPITNRY